MIASVKLGINVMKNSAINNFKYHNRIFYKIKRTHKKLMFSINGSVFKKTQ